MLLKAKKPSSEMKNVIKLAILAVGGQGGGVLANWIEKVARASGYSAQSTSVAGVAQRTGATIYYIEMAPAGIQDPIFALAPSAGDVDILIAAEMMEAGRAIMRGFVSPDKTTLIASTHRSLAISEKIIPGDGIASSEEVKAAAKISADKLVIFDMNKIATDCGSVISSALFGALAGSKSLPFPKVSFEEAIMTTGRAVESSLGAFSKAYDMALKGQEESPKKISENKLKAKVPKKLNKEWETLNRQIESLPMSLIEIARHGVRKVVDFQDIDYGRLYLEKLNSLIEIDKGDGTLSKEAAKYIANAMAYNDVINIADIKSSSKRLELIKKEMKIEGESFQLTEYLHPRSEEIIGLLPYRLGMWLEKQPKFVRLIDRFFNKGRRINSNRIWGFFLLYFLGGLRNYRKYTLRHKIEQKHLNRWLSDCHELSMINYKLGVEILRCQRLIKGYSDTHARGCSKFDKIMKTIHLIKHREDADKWMVRMKFAALEDEKSEALEGVIKTINSFKKK